MNNKIDWQIDHYSEGGVHTGNVQIWADVTEAQALEIKKGGQNMKTTNKNKANHTEGETNKVSHTPTPLEIQAELHYLLKGSSAPQEIKEAIVRAVNSHAALLEAANSAFEELNFDGTFTVTEVLKTVEAVRTELRKAVTQAEGK